MSSVDTDSIMCISLYHYYKCSICHELRDDIVAMECMHSLCNSCLNTLQDNSDNGSLQCPECRQTIVVPDTGFKLDRTKNSVISEMKLKQSIYQPCEQHREECLQTFCKECKQSLCIQCAREEKHRNHELVNISKINTATKQRIDDELTKREVIIKKFTENEETCIRYIEELQKNNVPFSQIIINSFSKFTDKITEEKQTALTEVEKEMNKEREKFEREQKFYRLQITKLQSDQERLKNLKSEFLMEERIRKTDEFCQEGDNYLSTIEEKQILNIDKRSFEFEQQELPENFKILGNLKICDKTSMKGDQRTLKEEMKNLLTNNERLEEELKRKEDLNSELTNKNQEQEKLLEEQKRNIEHCQQTIKNLSIETEQLRQTIGKLSSKRNNLRSHLTSTIKIYELALLQDNASQDVDNRESEASSAAVVDYADKESTSRKCHSLQDSHNGNCHSGRSFEAPN